MPPILTKIKSTQLYLLQSTQEHELHLLLLISLAMARVAVVFGTPFAVPLECEEDEIGSWITLTTNDSPTARHEATFILGQGGMGYLLGGRRRKPDHVLHTATSTWTKKDDSPV